MAENPRKQRRSLRRRWNERGLRHEMGQLLRFDAESRRDQLPLTGFHVKSWQSLLDRCPPGELHEQIAAILNQRTIDAVIEFGRWERGDIGPSRTLAAPTEEELRTVGDRVDSDLATVDTAIEHFTDNADAELEELVSSAQATMVSAGPAPEDPNLPELDAGDIAPLRSLCDQARRLFHRALVDGTVDPAWQGKEDADHAPRVVASRIAVGVVTENPDLTESLIDMFPGLKTSPVTLPTLRSFPAPVGAVMQEVERHLEAEGELFGLWAPGKRTLPPTTPAPRFSPGDFLDL
jgi:hypothetical protein